MKPQCSILWMFERIADYNKQVVCSLRLLSGRFLWIKTKSTIRQFREICHCTSVNVIWLERFLVLIQLAVPGPYRCRNIHNRYTHCSQNDLRIIFLHQLYLPSPLFEPATNIWMIQCWKSKLLIDYRSSVRPWQLDRFLSSAQLYVQKAYAKCEIY